MKTIRSIIVSLTLFTITWFLMGTVAAWAEQSSRDETTAIVSSEPAVQSPQSQSLTASNAAAGPAPAGQASGITPAFAGDVLVADFTQIDANPDMVSTASGKYYLVRDRGDDACMDVFTSSNGGQSWSWFYWICDGSVNIQNPAIAVPELTEDFAYVVYETNYEIRLIKIDLATLGNAFYTIQPANYDPSGYPHGSHRPRIVTDNNDWAGYYLYVTYIEDSWGDVPNMVKTGRSFDKGVTWVDYRYPENFPSNVFEAKHKVDIAYGNVNQLLYVTWDQNVTLSGKDVFVSRSSDFGWTWDTPVDMCSGTPLDCYEPRVAAIQDGTQAMVVYSWAFGGPYYDDVGMGYSTDQGATWNLGNILPWTYNFDQKPDITVDPSLGDFHVAFWSGGGGTQEIRYTHAPSTSPTAWSSAVVVNDTNQASWDTPTVAVNWTSNMACVAWADWRSPTNAIYSDCFDTTAPGGTISINGGAAYTNTTAVTLTLSCTDTESGCYQMRFSNDMGAWSAWEAYAASKAWTLNSGDGSHDVDVQFIDKAGNVSPAWWIFDSIMLDTTAPTGTISINSGATYTTSTSVTLTLSCTDATSGCSQMRFSNDNAIWSGWESNAASKAWTLTSGDGTKTVYVQYKDNAGNASGSFFDTIILQTLPNVSVTLTPDSTTIPRGSSLGYNVTVTNNTGSQQCFHYWTNVKLPNGSKYPPAGQLFGPYYLCLNAYASKLAHLTHAIPNSAPLGVYTYNGFVGPYPTVWDEDHFNFTVTTALAPQSARIKGWELLENGFE